MLRFLSSSVSMRAWIPLSTVLALAAGCGDPNAGALWADIQYATRCEGTLGCEGVRDHDICGFNASDPCDEGRPSPALSCNVTEADPTRTLNFSARQDSGASISVDNLIVPFTGGSATGGACRVTVVEGANTYVGPCGGSPPADEGVPCQISGVTFTNVEGNPTIEGRIFCQFLENRANPVLEIEVTANGPGPGPAGMPARFTIANCSGLRVAP